ncbi:MAG: hypothetical protein GY722_08495 [bacterium]|nr:hypothetical protein [bacterium]
MKKLQSLALIGCATPFVIAMTYPRFGPPVRYIQISHTSPWTHPASSTKWVAENDDGSGTPEQTTYLTDYNVDYAVLRVRDKDTNSNGYVGGTDTSWGEDIVVDFKVTNAAVQDVDDITLYSQNPLTTSTPTEITSTGGTTNGNEYSITIGDGDVAFVIWFEFEGFTAPSLQVFELELLDATDQGGSPEPMDIGWSNIQRFIYEDYDADLVESPACISGSGNVVHFGPIMARTKIPYVDTEVLSEGDGTGYSSGNNEYRNHKIVIRDDNTDTGCWYHYNHKVGGSPDTYNNDLLVTIKQGDSSGTTSGMADEDDDFKILDATGGDVEPEDTTPETWVIEIPAGESEALFGIRIVRDQTDETGDWEELILVIDDFEFEAGSETEPTVGWKDQLRFIIEDEN